ncbi:hypothetical protein MXD81_35075 [Microbacteriaceae bacterium K1510]|nr:hypothetical protein [Microbacteriaceae bacterium K1510]
MVDVGPLVVVEGEEDVIKIGFDAVAAYHGQAALAMLAVTFQALRLALSTLSSSAPPRRGDISILSGHPGPGVRDAFEFVTRAVTRNAYVVDRSLPEGRLVPGANISYSFRITVDGRTAILSLRPDALPQRFFTLNFTPFRSPAEELELSALKRSIAKNVLATPAEALFTLAVA